MRRGRPRVQVTVSRERLLMAAVGLVAVLVACMAMPAGMGPAGDSAQVSAYLTGHAPIIIDSLDDFNAENGVVSGDGSAEDPFVIEGLDVAADPEPVCVAVRDVGAHVVFRAMHLHDGDYGVSLYWCSNVSFVDSNISGIVSEEVSMLFSHHIIFSNCSILSDSWAAVPGTVVDRCTDITFTGNRFYGKGISFEPEEGFDGASPDEEFASHVITPDNLLDGRPVLYYKSQSGVVVDGVSAGQVILADCASASISDIVITGGDVAVFAANCPGLSVSGCSLSRNYIGIRVHNSPGCAVTENEVDDADTGIWVGKGSNGSLVANNTLADSNNYGLRVEMCSATVSGNSVAGGNGGIMVGLYVGPVTVRNNTVSNSVTGIQVTHMYQETAIVEGNEVVGCSRGIRVTLSEGAEVSENYLTENVYGIMLETCWDCTVRDNFITDGDYGIYLVDCTGVEVVDNWVDRVEVETYDDNEGENSWDTEGYTLGMVAVIVAVSLLIVVLLAVIIYRRRKAA